MVAPMAHTHWWQPGNGGWEVGGEWANVVTTPPDRRWVVAGPVGSGHGSYQLVSWWGGQCWCPPMAHTQWWQSGSGGSETAASTLSCRHGRKISEKKRDMTCDELELELAIKERITEYGPWAPTLATPP